MEGRSDVGSTGPQSVPDTQGNIRHGQAKVFEEGDHHHDSAANHTEAAIGNTGELCNRRTSRIDSRNHGDNQKDDPCNGASQSAAFRPCWAAVAVKVATLQAVVIAV